MSLLEFIKTKRSLRKVLLLGSGAVGKTSIVKVLKADQSLKEVDGDLAYHRTPFIELETVKTSRLVQGCSDEGILQLWDLSGQQDLPIHATREISRTSLGGVDLVMLVFASDNIQSLLDLASWLKVVEDYYSKESAGKEPSYILIRNKTDLKCTIDLELTDKVLKHKEKIIKYFQISCLTGNGLNNLKEWLIDQFSPQVAY
ncbi:MAG: GTPase domain-containing protein [Candidatus Odinarchaeota archaeon]